MSQRVISVILGTAAAAAMLAAAETGDRNIARGKYLVERVSMCGNCHTPRDEKGQLIQQKWLQGAKLEFEPTQPMPVWAAYAPAIAGLPGLQEDEAVMLLAGSGARRPRPPHPAFRMEHADAEAVVAYLKSLKHGAAR